MQQTESITIDAPTADVWPLIGSIDGWQSWLTGISNVELLSDEIGPGAEFGYTFRGRAVTATVDRYEEGRIMAIASTESSYDFGESMELEPLGDQTWATFTMGFEPTTWWAKAGSALLTPLKDRMLGKPLRKELATLKGVVEGE